KGLSSVPGLSSLPWLGSTYLAGPLVLGVAAGPGSGLSGACEAYSIGPIAVAPGTGFAAGCCATAPAANQASPTNPSTEGRPKQYMNRTAQRCANMAWLLGRGAARFPQRGIRAGYLGHSSTRP